MTHANQVGGLTNWFIETLRQLGTEQYTPPFDGESNTDIYSAYLTQPGGSNQSPKNNGPKGAKHLLLWAGIEPTTLQVILMPLPIFAGKQ